MAKRLGWEQWTENPSLTRAQRVLKLKSLLSEKHDPGIAHWNREIRSSLERAGLPGFAELRWDPVLEKTGVQLRAELRSLKQVLDLGESLIRPGSAAEWEKIFRIV
jgi:hypothetical protein